MQKWNSLQESKKKKKAFCNIICQLNLYLEYFHTPTMNKNGYNSDDVFIITLIQL